MRLIELLTTIPAQDIAREHDDLFMTPDGKYSLDAQWYQSEFLPLIQSKVLVSNTGNHIQVNHIKTVYDDPQDNEESLDSSLVDDEGKTWGMSFMPWGELLGMEVQDATHLGLSPARLAAAVFWELTWHGLESDMEAKRDELEDAIEEIDDAIQSGTISTITKPFNLDDFVGAQTMEEQAEMDRYRANLRTGRVYKNGQLIEDHRDA